MSPTGEGSCGWRLTCSRSARPSTRSGERGTPVRMRAPTTCRRAARSCGLREPPALGDRFWLELTFASPRFLVFVEAEVVRTGHPAAFAVRFVGLDEYVEQRVVRWVYAQDRRLFDRHAKVRIPIRIRVVCRGWRTARPVEEFTAPSVDVSTDVVRIVSERVVLVGTALQVELHLADDVPPFAVLAEVESAHPQDDERTVYTLRLARARRRRRAPPGRARPADRARATPVDWNHDDGRAKRTG